MILEFEMIFLFFFLFSFLFFLNEYSATLLCVLYIYRKKSRKRFTFAPAAFPGTMVSSSAREQPADSESSETLPKSPLERLGVSCMAPLYRFLSFSLSPSLSFSVSSLGVFFLFFFRFFSFSLFFSFLFADRFTISIQRGTVRRSLFQTREILKKLIRRKKKNATVLILYHCSCSIIVDVSSNYVI